MPQAAGEFREGRLWYQRKGAVLTLGVTDSALEQVGTIESIDFPDEGEDFQKGSVIATVDGTHGSLEVTTPVGGVVQEINGSAKEDCNVVSEDPLEEGWLVKIEVQDSADEDEDEGEEDDDSEDEVDDSEE